jgi:hypothetical protein
MPSLRGHHLICLQFFKGEGYNAEFVENLKNVLKAAEGHEIDIKNGADDVCGKCPHLSHSRCEYSEGADEGIAEMDRKALALLNLSQDIKVRWEEIGQRIPHLFPVWHNAYCIECSWRTACGKNDLYRQLRASTPRET